jgi:hypothetical protein
LGGIGNANAFKQALRRTALKNYLLFFLFEYYKLASTECAGTMRIFGVTHA